MAKGLWCTQFNIQNSTFKISYSMFKLAIFISGRGTNMEAILASCKSGEIEANPVVVFCNNPNAAGIDIAKSYGIPVEVINHREFSSRSEYDQAVIECLNQYNYDLVCLAGYMRLVTKGFLSSLKSPIINIHPSLLPDFKGANAVEDAYNAGVTKAGCTVHHVVHEMDAGEIITQRQVAVASGETLEGLKAKILVEEHIAYRDAINFMIKNNAK